MTDPNDDTAETQMQRIMSNLKTTLEAPLNDMAPSAPPAPPENNYLTDKNLTDKKWSPPQPTDVKHAEVVERYGFHHQQTPLQSIAGQISRLIYEDMMEMASELHSDSDGIGKSPADIAAIMHKWAKRKLDAGK